MDKIYFRFDVAGESHLYVHGATRLPEARAFQAVTKTPYGTLMDRLAEYDADAFAGMYWLAAQRAGERVGWDDLDINLDELMATCREVDGPDEDANTVVRDQVTGAIKSLVRPDGTEFVPEPQDPTSPATTTSDA